MAIIRAAMMALALAGGAGGSGLETKVQPAEEQIKYTTINGKTYRQRPPGAVCDPTLYGTPVKEEPQKPIPKEPIYFALLAAAVAITADTLRRKQDALIAKYETPEREFDFFNNRRQPIIEYKIEIEDKEKYDF
jgi:hypothetical protein